MSVSRALVDSSKRYIVGCRIRHRAIATLCFCPPDICDPFCPTSFYKPYYQSAMNLEQQDIYSAFLMA